MNTLYLHSEIYYSLWSILSLFIGISLFFAVYYIWFEKKFYKNTRIGVCIGLVVAGIIFLYLFFGLSERKIILECTIEDTYSAVELYKNYKVLDKRGDIWVLERKKGFTEKGDDDDKLRDRYDTDQSELYFR